MEYNIEKISDKIGKQKAISKVIKTIIAIILIFIFIVNANLLYYNLKGDKTPKIFRIILF